MRTYLPTISRLIRTVCGLMSQHRETILRVVGEDKAPQFDAYMAACDVWRDVIAPFVEKQN